MTIAAGQTAASADILKHSTADGYLRLTASTELTIASGAVTVNANFYRVDTEADASSDNLDTITAGAEVADGFLLVLRAENDARTVVIKHNSGNIMCANGEDQWLDNSHDTALFVYDSNLTKWMALGLVAPLNINTASIAADAVDDTKAGNRVPQFYRRQGGSATGWSTEGTTNYTPTAVRMQGGAIVVPDASGSGHSFVTITFPVAFSQPPLIYVTVITPGVTTEELTTIVTVGTATATEVTIHCATPTNSEFLSDSYVNWLAIGPE